ncbi:MAG: class II aldolase/adducin family protein [Thermoleophilia bacterium]|nr:class II aldolase/adducin family protein [Thermoleophilia bacterium]
MSAGVREAVAATARLLVNAGLVEGFGHVSARLPDGGFVITSTGPLALQTAESVAVPGAGETPLEVPLHAAIYAVRPDVGAVCRTHSPYAVSWGARGEVPPLVHGLGLLAGEIASWDGTDLVVDAAAATAAAASLGAADCLLPRGNGLVCCGPDLGTAAVRAWFAEERARVALQAGPGAPPLAGPERERRGRHVAAELPRARQWLAHRFGDGTERPFG